MAPAGESSVGLDHGPGKASPFLGEVARAHVHEVDAVPPGGEPPAVGHLGPLEASPRPEVVGDCQDAHAR